MNCKLGKLKYKHVKCFLRYKLINKVCFSSGGLLGLNHFLLHSFNKLRHSDRKFACQHFIIS